MYLSDNFGYSFVDGIIEKGNISTASSSEELPLRSLSQLEKRNRTKSEYKKGLIDCIVDDIKGKYSHPLPKKNLKK